MKRKRYIVLLIISILALSINLLFAQPTDSDSLAPFIPAPVIKPELIYEPEIKIDTKDSTNTKYKVHFNIDSSGIPYNVKLDSLSCFKNDSLILNYFKQFRFKTIMDYPKSIRE